jgi:hypothetical protein
VVLVTLASAAMLVLAPGNAVRAEHASADAGQFWFSFSHAWYHAGVTLASWLSGPGLWLATAAFIPAALRLVHIDGIRKDTGWLRFLVILFLVPALVWTLFFGLWWAAATNPPGRALNLIYLIFLVGWFAGVLELVAVFALHRRLAFTAAVFPGPLRLANIAVLVLFGGFMLLHSHARTAASDLVRRAPAYNEVMQDRYASITRAKAAGNNRPAMVLPAVDDPPRVLMYSDIQADRRNWRNNCYARYFGLESVVRR